MITMRDIAREAGVSYTTVSYVLSDSERARSISEQTRQRVLEVAAELGYRRNELARAVVTGKSRVVGFLTPGSEVAPERENVSRLLAGVLEEAEMHGYFVKVLPLRGYSIDKAIMERCAELRLDGVISLHLDQDSLDALHREMARYQIPVALLETSRSYANSVRVFSDDAQGMQLAMQHLYDLGHRHIAMLSGALHSITTVLREKAYRQFLQQHNLVVNDDNIVHANWEIYKTREAAKELLQRENRPTAIVCDGDMMAIALLGIANQINIRVPEELSVVGYSNQSLTQWTVPALTTINQPFREMGRTAMRYLLEQMSVENNSINAAPETALPTQLVVRESTGPAHA